MQGKITPFVHNTFTILNESKTDDVVCWAPTGDAFIIKDQYAFSSDVLPRYFKHNNVSSFIRQLNTYQFHKVPNEEANFPVSSDDIVFSHPYFQKGRDDLLCNVVRRTKNHQRRPMSPSETRRINNPVPVPSQPTLPITLTENNNNSIPASMSPESMAKQVLHMYNRLEQTNHLLVSVHNELLETKDMLNRLQQNSSTGQTPSPGHSPVYLAPIQPPNHAHNMYD
mmetsp:Transcript_20803/g.26309  ORF Transcript_20803/g.26309 Transcript_20803/m.26309 type:complete len:225 (-) Transcript_20803:82-756(-)